jgi:hypothetical protein
MALICWKKHYYKRDVVYNIRYRRQGVPLKNLEFFLILCTATRILKFCTNDLYISENKGTYRNCEYVVGFGSHKPKRRTLHADHIRDPRVQRWPTHRIIKELQEKFGKHVFITKFICRYKTKMKGTLKRTTCKRHCAALYQIYLDTCI